MKPTETLRHEHQIVLLILDSAEQIVESHDLHADDIEKMIDFSKNFTDGCHHSKEEKHLFPKLCERGMSAEYGPIAVMLFEHKVGRKYVREIAEALPKARDGNADVITSLKSSLASYVQLLRAHIMKENSILFPMGDRILSPEDQSELAKAFDNVEAEEMREGIHQKYHQLAHELGKKFPKVEKNQV